MRKLILVCLAAKILCKAVLSGYLFISDQSALPVVVFGISFVLLLIGALVLCQNLMHKERRGNQDLMLYFTADAVGTMMNLFLAKSATMISINSMDMFVTGNLCDIVIAGLVVAFLFFTRNSDGHLTKQSFHPKEVTSKAQ